MACQSHRRQVCGVAFPVAVLYKKFIVYRCYVTDNKSISLCEVTGLHTSGVVKQKWIGKQDNDAPCASRHEDVWRNWGIAPRVLILGTRWRRVVSFTIVPLYPQRKSLVGLNTRQEAIWMGSRAGLVTMAKEKEIQNPSNLSPARSSLHLICPFFLCFPHDS
jgi:hypothetical protein